MKYGIKKPLRAGLGEAYKKRRRRPTLPQCSTIGATGLNGRVRDGNGWNPCAIATSQNQRAGQFFGIMPLGRGRAERASSSGVKRSMVSN